jgi:hypothetical protein
VSEAILVPYCGRAACHSADSQARNLAFDTITDCVTTLRLSVGRNPKPLVVPHDHAASYLFTLITGSDKPMPPDAPLPQPDIDLISDWIDSGATGLQ